jgi:WD40 repeat protein
MHGVFDHVEPMAFSYPMNLKYPDSVACSGVQAGFLMAYGSGNVIIVLVSGKDITAVLKEHSDTVCTVAFETRGPHIVSCDISGEVNFWHYQDTSWQKTRTVRLPHPARCMTWYTSRREICFSSNSGLYLSGVADFGIKSVRLCAESAFCAYNFDGSLLASHNHKKSVTIFTFVASNPYLVQVVRHPANIEVFDFHPSMPAFLTISSNYVLRIWRQGILSTFACLSAVSVPFLGRFVRPPSFSERKGFAVQKTVRIGFINDEGRQVFQEM